MICHTKIPAAKGRDFVRKIEENEKEFLCCCHSFTPPKATPATMYLERMKYTTNIGRMVTAIPIYSTP
jgi:hypothetical protein